MWDKMKWPRRGKMHNAEKPQPKRTELRMTPDSTDKARAM